MSRKNSFSCILNLLLSLGLEGLVLASGPNMGQEPQDPREASYLPEQGTRVTVLVYNYAHLPMQTLSQAQDRASLIFRKAGVELQWADCPLNNEDPALYPHCPALFGGTQLFLRIFPTTATKLDHAGESFVAARIAIIFWNRVDEQGQGLKVSAPRILAHTVAHELGHLLLGSNSHSPTGIMIPRWDSQAMTRICQHGLYFNRQQAEVIRTEMKKRIGQQRVVENALLTARQREPLQVILMPNHNIPGSHDWAQVAPIVGC